MIQKVISTSESCAISLLRSISMSCIIACHIFQGYGSPYAWIFNMGVQVFLAISGYLYGGKTVLSWKYWFETRLRKLYIPYLLFLLICIPIYYCYASNEISLVKILLHIFDLQGIIPSSGISGLGHLWFMSAIAICYLSTPLLQRFRKSSYTLPLLLIVALLEFSLVRFAEWPFSWLLVYALGYLYASGNKQGRILIVIFMSIALLSSLIFISWDDILRNGLWNQLLHISFGVLTVITFSFIANCRDFSIFSSRILTVVDRYSYDIYIVHHIFIIGPFSVLFLFASPFVNVVLILGLTFLMAFVLNKVSARLLVCFGKLKEY